MYIFPLLKKYQSGAIKASSLFVHFRQF